MLLVEYQISFPFNHHKGLRSRLFVQKDQPGYWQFRIEGPEK